MLKIFNDIYKYDSVNSGSVLDFLWAWNDPEMEDWQAQPGSLSTHGDDDYHIDDGGEDDDNDDDGEDDHHIDDDDDDDCENDHHIENGNDDVDGLIRFLFSLSFCFHSLICFLRNQLVWSFLIGRVFHNQEKCCKECFKKTF